MELVDMSAEERERAERETMETVRKSADDMEAAMMRQAAVAFVRGMKAGQAIAREKMAASASA